ncbi:hypothetical protein [Roseovarius rhodophyticola]|uniref:Restriction endonuclease type IV Mrr domain-containing protein n=1 Tax=Roseovarius rhodophyticola TaxID=3080827 RepID=A0ABZ2TKC9_9RHOB|nr:hypothetical protein [Roseovarius sp. W115]MDV2927890.1 hypothetical protein [Roseovarius sp. W115]
MDIERLVRDKLISLLQNGFDCTQEVQLRTVSGHNVRCDVLGIPRNEEFSGCCLAFECKRPSQEWHYAPWSRAIKQASDNVGADVTDQRFPDAGTVTAAFLFPAPMIVPRGSTQQANDLIRDGFEEAVAGMFHLALMFRVGKAGTTSLGKERQLSLVLGPNEIWNARNGFTKNGYDLLLSGRPIGSSNRK